MQCIFYNLLLVSIVFCLCYVPVTPPPLFVEFRRSSTRVDELHNNIISRVDCTLWVLRTNTVLNDGLIIEQFVVLYYYCFLSEMFLSDVALSPSWRFKKYNILLSGVRAFFHIRILLCFIIYVYRVILYSISFWSFLIIFIGKLCKSVTSRRPPKWRVCRTWCGIRQLFP